MVLSCRVIQCLHDIRREIFGIFQAHRNLHQSKADAVGFMLLPWNSLVNE